jgi:hypothetical protein
MYFLLYSMIGIVLGTLFFLDGMRSTVRTADCLLMATLTCLFWPFVLLCYALWKFMDVVDYFCRKIDKRRGL